MQQEAIDVGMFAQAASAFPERLSGVSNNPSLHCLEIARDYGCFDLTFRSSSGGDGQIQYRKGSSLRTSEMSTSLTPPGHCAPHQEDCELNVNAIAHATCTEFVHSLTNGRARPGIA